VATSGQLVEAVSEATGTAAETVVVHMRNLREAGLVDIRGRGRSAAKMTARDAARLVMAVLGTSHVKESVGAVLSFGALTAYRRELVAPKERTVPVAIVPHWTEGSRHWSVGYPLMTELNGDEVRKRYGLGRVKLGATFEEAMIALIEGTLADTLFPPLQSSDFLKPPSKIANYKKHLWVALYRPEAYAAITYLAEGITYEKMLFQKKSDGANATYSDTGVRKKQAAVAYRQSDLLERSFKIVCDALRA
jgi:DNA-binding transcriptional ArsR family regulator